MPENPTWITSQGPPDRSELVNVAEMLDSLDLNTVCLEADCPNIGECWGSGTATFIILGATCTRNCRFCEVDTGNPGGELDSGEPCRIQQACESLGLEHVVLTSVDRDDLPDGGAEHFRDVITRTEAGRTNPSVEALIPDFSGDRSSLSTVVNSGVEVIGHNLETVRRLTPKVRDPRAGYDLSLSVLESVKDIDEEMVTKSSLMVGLGEEKGEVLTALRDLRGAGVDMVTIGQYLRPSEDQLPVVDFLQPSDFEFFEKEARRIGFPAVLSGPLVRSSYKAKQLYRSLK